MLRGSLRTKPLGGQLIVGLTSGAPDAASIGAPLTKSVLGVGFALLLLVGIVIYVFLTRGNSFMKIRHCKGLTCVDPYEALESILNHTVKPCDDMYAHVCSQWTGNKEHAGFLQESLNNYLTKMQGVFQTSNVNAVGEGLGDGLLTCAHLFSQCLTAMKTKEFSLKEDIPYLMNKLLLTRVMESRTSREALQEGTEASFTFDLNGFLTLRPQRMDTAAVMYAFQGSAIQTTLPATADLKAYIEAFVKTTNISQESPSRTSAILSLDRIVVARKRHAKSASKKILVKRIHDESPLLDALVARPINRLARMSSLSKGYLLVRDYDNTMALIRIIEKAPRQDITLYLVVQMLTDLLILDQVAQSEANDKWQVLRACSGTVSRATSHVWSSLSRQLMLSKTSIDRVLELFVGVKATVTSDESFLRNLLEDSTYRRLQKTLGNVSFVSNRELLEQQRNLVLTSGSLLPTDKNFVRNYFAVRHQTRSLALVWPPSALWDIASISEMELRPTYNEETNSLFLSTVLQVPHVFYPDDSARLLNYGTLGAALARELIRSFVRLHENESQRSDGKATKALLERLTCYAEYGTDHSAGNVTDFQKEMFPWLASAKLAYTAMRKTFHGGGVRANSTWKTVQKQFFLRFCLAACESSDETVVNGRHKCVWPLADNRAFSEAFDCPANSHMSFRQCHLYIGG